MDFGSLSSAHQIMILLSLKGGPAYTAQMDAAATSNSVFARSLLETSANMEQATKRSWLHNQALFTARRYAFYATLAVTGLAYEIGKLGFSYLSTIQGARVALRGMFDTRQEMNKTIHTLYNLSTFSPFLFKDTLTAFRTMAPAMKNAGIPVTETLRTMHATMDALSQSGHTSVGNLTRVSIQLQHLANIGRPTGQVLLALARDGLPVYPALRKELGLTGTSLENLSTSGLTAAQTIEALNKFIETSPIYQGQAFKQATQTLTGNWQMFKDILAQAAGTSEGGLFGGLTARLKAINLYLRPFLLAGKPIGLYNIAQAIDSVLSPKTHLIINLFVAFNTALRTMMFTVGVVAKGIQIILYPFDKLASLFGVNTLAAKVFGGFLGILAGIFILTKIALMPFVIAFEAWNATVRVAKGLAAAYRVVMLILNGEWAATRALIMGNTVATEANTVAQEANSASMVQKTFIMGAMSDGMVASSIAAEEAAGGMALFGSSMAAAMGPIGLLLVALPLIIMYHKQLENFGLRGNRAVHNAIHKFAQDPVGHTKHGFSDFFHGVGHAFSRSWSDEKRVFGFASGGTMPFSGPAIVGERGPELMNLPGGTKITPLNNRSLMGAGSLAIHIYPQDIYLDGKKFATVLAQATTDKQARMSGRNS